jgi:nucleoprotein TPR
LKLESDIEQARTATHHDASVTTAMRSRIASLESSNRDTLALLESKTTAYNSLSQEMATQHEKVVELRKQVSGLEQTIQTANSAAASARFREQSLEQECDLLKKNSEWLENELKTKAAEHTKFRKEKNAQVAELSQRTEQYISEADALRRSEASLRSRLDQQVQKVEDLMQEMQQLQERSLLDTENLRADLDSANRLASLQEDKAKSNKERADQLLAAYEEARETAAEEIGLLRAEMETEHSDREAAERRVAELESTVQQLEHEIGSRRSRPTTPSRGMNGLEMSSPIRQGTPSGIFSPASGPRMLGNLSMTQMYSQYQQLERNLAMEKETTERLQAELDDMLQDLELNRPEINELRSEHDRLQSEVIEMSSLVQAANRERDAALKQVRTLQGQVESQSKEAALLTQQVRDAEAQVKVLLIEQNVQAGGEQLSESEYEGLLQRAYGDIDHETPTSQFITSQLTTFRNIAELTEQSSQMRKLIRELGERLEGEEAQAKEQHHRDQARELEEARLQLALLQDEVKSMLANSESFKKERDMFKDMLTRKGRLIQSENNDFARSLPLPAGSSHAFDGSVRGSTPGGDTDYGKLVRDLQAHLDSYRQESITDQTALKSQINDLSKRNLELQTEASRTLSLLSAANQRNDMLQANFTALKTENAEIQKRCQTFMENATRQELKSQQAAEELIENKGMLDGMRRDVANLKAEKDQFKSIERRLIEEVESLRNDRARLDQLNGSLQAMLNEREHSDAEVRRRLQSQVESLDSELQTTKRRLNDEVDEAKKASLRREYELEQNQKRIDDLVTTLGSLREELSATKTTGNHLQARVDELTIDLRSAEERVAVLTQPPPQTTEETSNDSTLTPEQELAIEISELKRELEQKTIELARTVEQTEVYRSISQQAEERLQELMETDGQYREETEQALADKDGKIKDLEQRVEDITSELGTTNSELSQLRDEHSESTRRLDEQKHTFEAEIARIKDEAQRNLEQAQYNLETTKAQAQIAAEFQQKYEDLAITSGEAYKASRDATAQVNQLKLDVAESVTKAESAIQDLTHKEESWAEMKSRYDRELRDLKQRREEVVQQNTLLHNQLETLTSQISQLQKDRAATVNSDINNQSPMAGTDNLQEVIKYLRREKEIVDVQYHLSTQEQKRLRQQLDLTQSQLDETRLKLDQQRRIEADTERNAISHKKLLDTLNELNLYRESSVTLRSEAKRATDALAEKTRRVEELVEQLEPLQTRIAELENLSEMTAGEMRLLQEDRDHWQQRTQNILSKYDRVDPAELESLKEKVTSLETERDKVAASRDDLQAQVDNISDQVKTSNAELRARLGEQFKAKVKELNGKIKDKQNEVDAANTKRDALQSELDSTREELEALRSQRSTVQANVNGDSAPEQESGASTGSGLETVVAELQDRVKELEQSLAEKEQEIASLKQQHEADLQEQRTRVEAEHQQALEELRAQSVPVSSELQKTHDVQAASQTQTAETGTNNETDVMPVITEAQARLLVKEHEVIRRILMTNIKKSVATKEEALRKEFELAQAAIRDTTSPEQVAELQKQVAAHEEALKQKEQEFAAQKQALVDQQQQLESEKLVFTEEGEKKIADQIALYEKRTAVQLNMAKNKANLAQAKVEVVKKAAEETPEKPVGEVWEVAKDAKPPPMKPATAASQPGPPSSPAGQKPPPAQNGLVDTTPTLTRPNTNINATAPPASAQSPTTNGVAKPAQPTAGSGVAMQKQPQTAIPRGIPTARGRGASVAGGQLTAASTGETQPSQVATRGTGIPRGNFRGAIRGRGGAPNIQTGGQVAARGGLAAGGSPRGNLNPAAQQFQPGVKRAREDGEATGGGVEKKIRGPSAGAGSA